MHPAHLEPMLAEALEAARALGVARAAELEVNQDIALGRVAAARRIMESGPDPVTGKPHSYTSAEKLVESDDDFAALLQRRRLAVLRVPQAEAEFFAARARVLAALQDLALAREMAALGSEELR